MVTCHLRYLLVGHSYIATGNTLVILGEKWPLPIFFCVSNHLRISLLTITNRRIGAGGIHLRLVKSFNVVGDRLALFVVRVTSCARVPYEMIRVIHMIRTFHITVNIRSDVYEVLL